MCPFFFNNTAIYQFTSVLINHFGGHFSAANLSFNFRSVIFVTYNRHARTKAHRIKLIGNLLICINMRSAHLKQSDNKLCLILIRFKNSPLAVFSINLNAAKPIVRPSHPIAKLCIADLRANHTAHNIAHLVLSSFSLKILRFLCGIEFAPIVFKTSVFKGVNLLLTNNTIHILKCDTKPSQLPLQR